MLKAIGLAYCDLLRDRELLLCQLQAYAACSDPEIREVVGDEFISIYRLVARPVRRRATTSSRTWFAMGMLMNTAAAIGPEMAEAGDFTFASLGRIAAAR